MIKCKKKDRFEDIEYLRSLSITELKFLSILLKDDNLVKKVIEEGLNND